MFYILKKLYIKEEKELLSVERSRCSLQRRSTSTSSYSRRPASSSVDNNNFVFKSEQGDSIIGENSAEVGPPASSLRRRHQIDLENTSSPIRGRKPIRYEPSPHQLSCDDGDEGSSRRSGGNRERQKMEILKPLVSFTIKMQKF